MDALNKHATTKLPELVNRVVLATALVVIGASKLLLLGNEAPKGLMIAVPVLIAIGLLESAVGVAVLLRPRVAVAWTALSLSLAFLLGTVVLVGTMSDLDSCGCFGPWRASAGVHLAVALGLVLMSLAVLADVSRRRPVVRMAI
ncbi:MAG: hypothetical protein KDC87_10360 [Planctomycetes bacterium]|nr:hypothetical protein [Planctomycetota bacterium]MCB9871157.1 hypothetical protein [Planctomycetota bacterium]